MPPKLVDLSSEEAEKSVQQLYARRRNLLKANDRHIWSYFEPAKIADSKNNLKFQIVLKCASCSGTVSALSPSTTILAAVRDCGP